MLVQNSYIYICTANTKDVAWLLVRHYSSPQQPVPAWTGFNQRTIKDTQDTTTMGYLPIINAPAHERDTLWTVIGRCVRITHELNAGQSTVLTFDEQLYAKAKELQWENPDTCRSLCVRLGGFHIAKNFMKAIGQHYADSGLQEIWLESSVYGENTAHNNMMAKSYNRTTRAHKLTVEALWHIMWLNFQAWAQERGIGEDLQRLSEEVATSMDDSGDLEWPSNPTETLKTLEEQVEGRDLLQLLEQYDKTLSPTGLYWRHYMKMVMILLQFIRAERTGDWQMHKSAFMAMLPWFAHYDHTNYTRWGSGLCC